MSVRSVLARGRASHLQLLVDVCAVKRVTGQVLDPDTDVLTPTYATIYSGACRLKAYRIGRPTVAGDVSIELQRYEIHLPWNASTAVARDDVLTMTTTDDSWVVGRPLTVTDVSYGGTTTVRHIIVEDRA